MIAVCLVYAARSLLVVGACHLIGRAVCCVVVKKREYVAFVFEYFVLDACPVRLERWADLPFYVAFLLSPLSCSCFLFFLSSFSVFRSFMPSTGGVDRLYPG